MKYKRLLNCRFCVWVEKIKYSLYKCYISKSLYIRYDCVTQKFKEFLHKNILIKSPYFNLCVWVDKSKYSLYKSYIEQISLLQILAYLMVFYFIESATHTGFKFSFTIRKTQLSLWPDCLQRWTIFRMKKHVPKFEVSFSQRNFSNRVYI